MIDYILEPDETIIGVYTPSSIKRVKNKLKRLRLLLLIPKKETLVSYFIVKRNMLNEFTNIKGVDERTNLKTSDFAELKDETIYCKSRQKQTESQQKLFRVAL